MRECLQKLTEMAKKDPSEEAKFLHKILTRINKKCKGGDYKMELKFEPEELSERQKKVLHEFLCGSDEDKEDE